MKTILDLPDDLLLELEARAARQGKPLKDIVAESLRKELFPPASTLALTRPKIVKDAEFGHDVVESSSEAPICKMTITEILKLEQDTLYQEDLKRAGIPF